MRKIILLLIVTILLSVLSADVDLSLAKEIDHSLNRGLLWLEKQQEDDGSWNHYPAITSLCLLSILRSYPEVTADYEPVRKGLEFISKCVTLDGSIQVGDLPNYNTALSLLALKEADPVTYKDVIIKAEQYLMGNQLTETRNFNPDSLYYGGMGYDGSDNRPDMSNFQWTAESLVYVKNQNAAQEINAVEDPNAEAKSLFFQKALTFLGRCQNLSAYNPESYSTDDGGFIYEVGKSKIGDTRSYGTMTYAGLKSMLYAKLHKDDPRIEAAYNWLRENYRVDETAKMGNQGLYYYWLTMARALTVYNNDEFTDASGVTHNWRKELASEIIKVQNTEGWWINENARWWENNPVLVTAYALLALEEIK